jgi:hypothetical protein
MINFPDIYQLSTLIINFPDTEITAPSALTGNVVRHDR